MDIYGLRPRRSQIYERWLFKMTYNKKTIEDIAVAGKKVIARCDFNVPMQNGVITDD